MIFRLIGFQIRFLRFIWTQGIFGILTDPESLLNWFSNELTGRNFADIFNKEPIQNGPSLQDKSQYAITMSHNQQKNELEIALHCKETIDMYAATFTMKDLQKAGFRSSIAEVVPIIHGAFNGTDPAMSVDIKKVRNCLHVSIAHDLKFFKQQYKFTLCRKKKDDTTILRDYVNDLQVEMKDQQERLKALEDEIRRPIIGFWKGAGISSDGHLLWRESSLYTEVPTEAFRWRNGGKTLEIIKEGIYKIHGAVCITNGKSYKILINGTHVWYGRNCNDYAQEEFGQKKKYDVTGCFDYIADLKSGDEIEISGHGAAFIADANVLMVEKMA